MKKHLLVLMLAVACVSLFADVTPYGSARVGIGFENTDRAYNLNDNGVDKARPDVNLELQESSHFGIDWTNRSFEGKVEVDGTGKLDQLWVRRNFNCFKLTFGLMEDGTNVLADQAYKHDMGLEGYGAVYGGTNAAVRLDHKLGIYLALIAPTKIGTVNTDLCDPITDKDGDSYNEKFAKSLDAVIPRINIGWEGKAGKVGLRPSLVIQTMSYNKEFYAPGVENATEFDKDIVSYLGSMSVDYADNKFKMLLNLNFGQNTGNMGYEGPNNFMIANLNAEQDDEGESYYGSANVYTYGGFFQFAFDVSKQLNLNAGVGFAQSETSSANEHFERPDNRIAGYLQGKFSTSFGVDIIPEAGLVHDWKGYKTEIRDTEKNEKEAVRDGGTVYVGAQLRYNF